MSTVDYLVNQVAALRSEVAEWQATVREVATNGNPEMMAYALEQSVLMVDAILNLATDIIAQILAKQIEAEEKK